MAWSGLASMPVLKWLAVMADEHLPIPWTPLRHVFVYDDPDTEGLNTDAIAQYLADALPLAEVRVRSDYLTHQLRRYAEQGGEELIAELTEQFRRAQVDNLVHPADRGLLPPEAPADLGLGEIYRGQALQAMFALMMLADEAALDQLHIVLTSMVFGDWDEHTREFRVRVAAPGAAKPHLYHRPHRGPGAAA